MHFCDVSKGQVALRYIHVSVCVCVYSGVSVDR